MKNKPKTATQWLSLPEAERGVALAEVLAEKPWKHEMPKCSGETIQEHELLFYCSCCPKCGLSIKVDVFPNQTDSWIAQAGPTWGPCPIPDPIVIDWNTAMAWRDKVVAGKDSTVFANYLLEVFGGGTEGDIDECLARAQAYDYLVVAAMAKKRQG